MGTKVLVVDDDAAFSSAIARDLSAHAFQVTTASTVDEAILVLARDPVDVVVTDLRMGDRDGIDLLGACRAAARPARTILMSAYATARDYDTALQLGAVRVLCKPFTPRELIEAIREAVECEHGFHGNVHGLSLLDILQMFHYGRRNATIIIGGTKPGRIYVEGGDIVHAEVADATGERALVALLSTRSGSIRTTVLGDHARTIARPFEWMILDALRIVDESVRDASDDGDDIPDNWDFEPPTARVVAPPTDDGWGPARVFLERTAPHLSAAVYDTAHGTLRVLRGDMAETEAVCVATAFVGALAHAPEVQCECVNDGLGLAFVRRPNAPFAILFFAPLGGRDAKSWFRSHTTAIAHRIAELAPGGLAA